MGGTAKGLATCLVFAFAVPATALAQPGSPEGAPAPTDPVPASTMVEPAPAPAMAPPPPQIVYVQAPETQFAKSVLYAELAGNAGIYSINYEHYLKPDAAIRVGLMYMSVGATSGDSSAKVTWTAIPLMFEYLGVSAGSHALELGAGISFNYMTGMSSSGGATAGVEGLAPIGTATIGYRYANPHGGFLFKAGYTPLIAISTPENKTANYSRIFHWGGMSFGYRF